ncbi:hypothetical protein [Streptomyces longispororuber]|uniref:hypothetical protein n=1 Tax=Streptomyces longispororuber TaxID=68230 RepID=UPI002109D80E|nr:hypothetical protein [Streptomyces longispororuber]MCQ4206179.1 hypothetical protein [Streptomyces longispororuber]
MRLAHRIAPAIAALALIIAVPSQAVPDDRSAGKKRELFGAQCRIEVDRSRVSATCHNPYPGVDRVALHIECDQWWDIDTDSRPRAVDPAETVRLDGRCWKNVRGAWVSHRKAPV